MLVIKERVGWVAHVIGAQLIRHRDVGIVTGDRHVVRLERHGVKANLDRVRRVGDVNDPQARSDEVSVIAGDVHTPDPPSS